MTRLQKTYLHVCLASAILAVYGSAQAFAATFTVNSTADAVDSAPGNAVCSDSAGRCTLRAAVMEANALPGAHTISVPAGVYQLSIPGQYETGAATGDLNIAGKVSIIGAGAASTIVDGGALDRVFAFRPTATALLSGLTVRNGKMDMGGGVATDGVVTISECVIRDNEAVGAYWFWANGGGIATFGGAALIDRTTVSNNDASGILNLGGILTIQNSTISGNRGRDAHGGGGLLHFSSNGNRTIIISSTFADNVAVWDRGHAIADAFSPPGSITVRNSILANPPGVTGDTCYGVSQASQGHNVASDGSCFLTGPGDLSNVTPLLGALAQNGGPTPTHALLAGSPAIDGVPAAACLDAAGAPLTVDQRGALRPAGNACDIGAFEFNDATPPVTALTASPAPNAFGWNNTNVTLSLAATDASGVQEDSVFPCRRADHGRFRDRQWGDGASGDYRRGNYDHHLLRHRQRQQPGRAQDLHGEDRQDCPGDHARQPHAG